MLPQIFSEWQPIGSTQQDALLRAAGIAEPEQWDNEWWNNSWTKLPHSSSVQEQATSLSVFLSHLPSLENSTLPESFPCSQHGRADAGWKTFLFSSSPWENEPVSGIGRVQLSLLSSESRYSMWVPVLIISVLPDIKMPSQPPHAVTTLLKCYFLNVECNLFCSACSVQILLIYQVQVPAKREKNTQ